MAIILALSFAGAVLASIIGTLWYSNATPMGKLHMRYLGFDKLSPEQQQQKVTEAKPTMWKLYVGQIVLSFITSFAVVFIMVTSIQNGLSPEMSFGFVLMNWLCFMVPVVGSTILWGNCDRDIAWKKFFSDISANLVTVFVIAILATLFV